MAVQWQRIYPARTTNAHKDNNGNDIGYTHQECLYAIVPAPGGGYVISGNNSSNFDDDYVVKFKDASSQTISGTIVDHEHVYYFGPSNLTIGPTFTIESTAYVELPLFTRWINPCAAASKCTTCSGGDSPCSSPAT